MNLVDPDDIPPDMRAAFDEIARWDSAQWRAVARGSTDYPRSRAALLARAEQIEEAERMNAWLELPPAAEPEEPAAR